MPGNTCGQNVTLDTYLEQGEFGVRLLLGQRGPGAAAGGVGDVAAGVHFTPAGQPRLIAEHFLIRGAARHLAVHAVHHNAEGTRTQNLSRSGADWPAGH